MDPLGVIAAHTLYPEVPIHHFSLSRRSSYPPNRVPETIWTKRRHEITFQEDHIGLEHEGREVWKLPASQIKTILRVDCLQADARYSRPESWLIASRETVEKLAVQCKRLPKGMEHLPNATLLRAIHTAYKRAYRWNESDLSQCHMLLTPFTREQLGRLCPQAEWVDISVLK